MRVHYHIAICLLKAHQHVHHLQLPLHDKGRVLEDAHGGMRFFDDAMGVFGDVDGRNEGVLGIRCGGESVGYGFDAGRWFLRWQRRRGLVFGASLLAVP